jgi:hypothetical protein
MVDVSVDEMGCKGAGCRLILRQTPRLVSRHPPSIGLPYWYARKARRSSAAITSRERG